MPLIKPDAQKYTSYVASKLQYRVRPLNRELEWKYPGTATAGNRGDEVAPAGNRVEWVKMLCISYYM